MDNIVFAAASGMKYRMQALNITANNMSNAESVGFKRSGIYSEEFGEHMIIRVIQEDKEDVGSIGYGVSAADIYTDFNQGTIKKTSNSLDLAINGNGFFSIEAENGVNCLTRAGSFLRNADGFLVDQNGSFVLGNNGRINLGNGSVNIDKNGNVYNEQGLVDTLNIITPEDEGIITRLNGNYFTYGGPTTEFSGEINAGYLEISNNNLIEEMTEMLRHSRGYQSCAQIAKLADQMSQKTVTEIGRV